MHYSFRYVTRSYYLNKELCSIVNRVHYSFRIRHRDLPNTCFQLKMTFDISDFGRTEAAREWELVVIPIDKKIISQVDTPVVPFENVINRSYPPIDIQIVSILRSPQK